MLRLYLVVSLQVVSAVLVKKILKGTETSLLYQPSAEGCKEKIQPDQATGIHIDRRS